MTGPGYGTVQLRVDHDLVGRVLAEKHRRRAERVDFADAIRPAISRFVGRAA